MFPIGQVAKKRIPKSPYPQNSGKGPVIDNIFSTSSTTSSTSVLTSTFTSKKDTPTFKHITATGSTTAIRRNILDKVKSREASYATPNGSLMEPKGGESLFENGVTDNVLGPGIAGLDPLETTGANMFYTGNHTTNTTYSYADGSTDTSWMSLLDCDNGDPFCNITGGNLTGDDVDDGPPEHSYWPLFLLVFPLFTVFGNVLVVLSIYRERSLRHVTNYFICSLAIADILVAVVVMPPAVFLEVTTYWSLSDELCDAWVAFDVMACTASILNLTAISVDRFIAVTQPIKYAKHKNSKRVHVMLVLTWVVSIAIALPIALGVNYSTARQPGACSFFNSDFLIYSSMGSFYIPSLIMIFLYWRIYRVLRTRARKSMQKKKARAIDTQTLTNVIENTAANTHANAHTNTTEPTVKTGLAKMDNGKLSSYNTNTNNCDSVNNHKETHIDDPSTSNPATDSQEKDEESDSKSPVHIATDGELIVNPVAEDLERREVLAAARHPVVSEATEMETNFSKDLNQDESSKPSSSDSKERRKKEKKNVTKFNFHMRTSRKRKERSSSRRERKATKTLAIVLGVFLLCWWPFFTVNIMRAICLRYEVLNYPTCDIDGKLMGFFVWLGYINSFLNPVIYTIFNPEFRKAFKKILTEPCKARY